MSCAAKVILGFRCNNSCIFCHEKRNRNLPQKNTREIFQEISVARKNGGSELHLIGGEPTIRPDIAEIISFGKKEGFKKIFMTTNGRMFAYLGFAKKIVNSGISDIIFSLHGPNAKIHDYHTKCPGSFREIMGGISNLKMIGFDQIGINTTITKNNYRFLPRLTDIFLKFKIRRVELICVISPNSRDFMKLTPKVSDSAVYILKILEIGRKNNLAWNLLNPPMGCQFLDFFDSNITYGDSRNEELLINTASARKIHEVSKRKVLNYIKIGKCKDCVIKNKCSGIWSIYLQNYGDKEVEKFQE
jgi:MoaA/NifB/PqqE/SkfB family radical SAM enzyme